MEYFFDWGVWRRHLPSERIRAALANAEVQAMSEDAIRAELSRIERDCFIDGFHITAFDLLNADDVERIMKISCIARAKGILRQPSPLPRLKADDHEYVRNFYHCDDCRWEWDDIWDVEVDDDCPACGSRHWQAIRSEPAGLLPDWVLYRSEELD